MYKLHYDNFLINEHDDDDDSVFGGTGDPQPYCRHFLALHNAFVFKYGERSL